jgi:outer membrane protein TolC
MRRPILVLLALLWAAAGAAQEPLTLPQAISLTLANNPAVRAADAGGKEAAERLEQAQAGYFPRVNVVESWQRGDQPVFVFSSLLSQRQFGPENFRIDTLNHPDAINNFRTMFAVEQPIYDGTRTPSAIKAARIGQSIATLDRERLAADLTLAATRAYGQVLQAQAARRSADAAVSSADEDLRRAGRRRDAGSRRTRTCWRSRCSRPDARAADPRRARGGRARRAERADGDRLERVYTLARCAAGRPPPDARARGRGDRARPELRQASLQRELALAQRAVVKSACCRRSRCRRGWS